MTIELRSQRKALDELWQKGLSGHELLSQLTGMVDTFIIDHFQQALLTQKCKGEIALVALGGYGRSELYPFSDIDLLIVHDRRAASVIKEIAEAVLYPLWDSGFEVGHSVRTLKDAISFSKEDFFFQVSLLDARYLAGSRELFNNLLSGNRKKNLEGRQKIFVSTMETFWLERRQKYGIHSFILEPHIKEGKGGMRDIQSMIWVAKAVFGLASLRDMGYSGMLTSEACRSFTESWNMLARVRNRLHYISQRKNDQLFFEYQQDMAEAFGYVDDGNMLAVEHFMRHLYGHLQTIAVTTDLFFEQVQDILGLTGPSGKEHVLEKFIVERNGSVRLSSSEVLKKHPHLLLRLFLQAGRNGLSVHHNVRQQVSNTLYLVDDKFRASKRNAQVLQDILVQIDDPMSVLEVMLETGLLTAYLPEYAGVESLAQHDLYHIYTVDRHQLQTVAELGILRKEQHELFKQISSPVLVFLAALLHDIGKGKQTDHSELGAQIISVIGQRLGFTAVECSSLSFLVQYHLFLPENALRRDLDDHEFIIKSAQLIGDTDRLTMLYMLSMADSKATGPSAWSSWKASLLAELYLKIKSCLEAQCSTEESVAEMARSEEHGLSWIQEKILNMLEHEEPIRMDISSLPEDYLMSIAPEMVKHHLQVHRDQAMRLQQQVLIFPQEHGDYGSLLIMSKDRPGLLAKIFGVLALHNFSVLAAQIFTWPDDTVVDVIDTDSVTGQKFSEHDWERFTVDLNLAVNYRLDVGYKLLNKLQAEVYKTRKNIQKLEQKVIIDNITSDRFSIIEVYSEDKLGKLYQLAQVLSDFGLNIHKAKIATEVEQLIDVFYVTKRDGQKITESVFENKLKDALLQIVFKDSMTV